MRTKREKKNILICKNTLENSLSRKMYKSTYSQKFDHNVVAHHDRYIHSTITSKLRRMIHEFLIFLFSKFLTFIIDKIHLQPKNTLFFFGRSMQRLDVGSQFIGQGLNPGHSGKAQVLTLVHLGTPNIDFF